MIIKNVNLFYVNTVAHQRSTNFEATACHDSPPTLNKNPEFVSDYMSNDRM